MSKTNHINKSRINPAVPYALNNLNSKLKIQKPKYSMNTSVKEFQQSNVKSNNNKKAIIDSEIKTSLKNDNQKHLSITTYDLAKDLLKKNELVIIEDILYYWDTFQRKYVDLNQANADKFVRQKIENKYKYKINSNSIKEIILWIKSREEIIIDHKILDDQKSYIPFNNGTYDLKNDVLLESNASFYFTYSINAKFKKKKSLDRTKFNDFLFQITNGDPDLCKRLQELFGYVISGYRELKYLPFLLGVKDSGKSIVLKLLEYLVGIENTTNLSFEQLNKSEYLVELFNKRLNTCGETSEVSLNKLDVFKKITGGDFIMARQLYNQPIKFINTAVLVFAGNHLPVIKGQDSYSAFSKRLLIFPFDYSVPKESQDIQLYDKLIDEIDYIALWAIKGLKRLIKNNFEFTTNEYIEAILDNFINNNNSISNFINCCCEINVTKQTHTYELYEAYESFCDINNYTLESNNQFCAFLNNLSGLQKTRFRKNGENKLGYKGIKLIEGEN